MTDVNVFVAFTAGIFSFLSPCMLPLIPSYISFISGVSLEELRDRFLLHYSRLGRGSIISLHRAGKA